MVRPDVELLFPFKVSSSYAIIFIKAATQQRQSWQDTQHLMCHLAVTSVAAVEEAVGEATAWAVYHLSLPGEANAARYSYVTEGIVDTILH